MCPLSESQRVKRCCPSIFEVEEREPTGDQAPGAIIEVVKLSSDILCMVCHMTATLMNCDGSRVDAVQTTKSCFVQGSPVSPATAKL